MQKLLDWKMAEFKIQFQAVWSQDGTFELLQTETGQSGDDADKEQSPSQS